jgi:hypothetical protein
MEVSPTPRQMAKGLLNGVAPLRPLFLPILFSLGAKVENIPLGAFLSNPTKIASALRQMRTHLRSDGAACYFDPFLEMEALGATLQRTSDDQAPTIHWQRAARRGELPEGLRSPEEAARSGRVPMAVEVIRRMNALPNRDFLLMAGVAGPLTLAARITQLENKESLRREDLSEDAQELAASAVTQMATTFLEAGADLIVIQEEITPDLSVDTCEAWASLLAPTINVVRFFEALPVVYFSRVPIPSQDWDLILRQDWNCVKCARLDVMEMRREGGHATDGTPFGAALPLEAFRHEGVHGKAPLQDIERWISVARPSIVTTAGDVPIATDMKYMSKVLEGIPRAV